MRKAVEYVRRETLDVWGCGISRQVDQGHKKRAHPAKLKKPHAYAHTADAVKNSVLQDVAIKNVIISSTSAISTLVCLAIGSISSDFWILAHIDCVINAILGMLLFRFSNKIYKKLFGCCILSLNSQFKTYRKEDLTQTNVELGSKKSQSGGTSKNNSKNSKDPVRLHLEAARSMSSVGSTPTKSDGIENTQSGSGDDRYV